MSKELKALLIILAVILLLMAVCLPAVLSELR